jgi:hypothetical protein
MKAWRTIAAHVRVSAREFVPGRRIDAFDQIYCRSAKHKQRLIEANHTFASSAPLHLYGRSVYILDGRHRDPAAVAVSLEQFAHRAQRSHLRLRSLKGLR